MSYKHQLGYIVNAFRKGLQVAKKADIDIIHANTYTPVIPGVILGKVLGIPIVATIHHIALGQWKLWSSQEGVHGSTSFIGPIYEKLILKLPVDMVHVVSNSTKEDLIRINPKAKVTMIYNGLDFGEGIKSNDIEYQDYILYIGRLAVTKNLTIVILGFRTVVQKFPNAKLIIVGEGGMRSELERLVKENGLERHVVFKGHVSPEIKQNLLSSCAALILPSTLEGFGRVIIEAFDMCKPVLVSNIPALAEIVDDGLDGFLISPDDVETWGEKIKFVLSNKEMCKTMGANGRKKAEDRFDLTSISNEIEYLYKDVISSRR
jgi:glycosyltransferase involved in cell wall biosynthesis